jgi:hypothetical protein
MQNLDRIYVIRFGEYSREYFHVYTKYILVAALAVGSYGLLLFTGTIKTPFEGVYTAIKKMLFE